MYWPIVLFVLSGAPVGFLFETEYPDGYATKTECEARLPDALSATKQMEFPVPREQIQFVPGCIDVTPKEFWETHFKSKMPEA